MFDLLGTFRNSVKIRFSEVLKETVWLLLTEKRISYRRLRIEFDLDDDRLEVLRYELIQIKRVAVDQEGEFLVWASGDRASIPDVVPLPALTPLVSRAGKEDPHDVLTELTEASARVQPPQSSGDAERRQLTVMFCDLADSTSLSTRLDPEDLQDMIRGYQETCTKIIREYEGFVAKYMGDGILVYFGYPKSLERNAERAVRSGLAIVEAMAGLNQRVGHDQGIELAIRIGIATGMVMVGEVVGEGLAQERTVIGEAPNMAARLQGVAGRNGIVIGELTKELSGEAFVYGDLVAHELKGISGLVNTWAVLGLHDDGVHKMDHDETSRAAAVPQLVGRNEETGLLRRAWQSTKDDERGQLVAISGEAGIGKSVLIAGLRAEVSAEGLPVITFRCSPYHTGSELYPVIEHFKRLCGWQLGDSAAARLAKLEAMLERYALSLDESVPLMASLLSLPQDRYPPLALTPQQQKQQTQDAIIAITLEEAERQPLLELWEDLHWADPSTLELLGLLIEQVPTVSLLMVLTARSEFVPPWPARSHITPITLNRLERPHTEALVERIAGLKPLPGEVVDHIVSKTDGVPLYVEELTKTILASNILRDNGERFELSGPLSSLAIPDTLQESLMARLDRLPQVRELAQLGSVLGREFAYEMISGLSSIGEATLQEGLGQLVEAELLYQRGRPPRAKYMFKHALIQDAAYESLLRRPREQYHRQVAQLFEARFPNIVEAQPELVAHHYSEAGLNKQAVDYWEQAADRGLARGANLEAVSHLSAALEALTRLEASAARDELELALQTKLGPAKLATEGFAYPPLEETYNRALELCVKLDKPVERVKVMRGLQLFHFVGGRLTQAMSLARQIAALVEELDDPAFCVAAAHVVGQTNFFAGNFSIALPELEKGIALYDPDKHLIPNWPGGTSGEQCYLYAAFILWIQGYPQKALKHCEVALDLANRQANKFNLANTLAFLALIRAMNRDMADCRVLAEQGVALCEEQGNSFYLNFNHMIRGWANLHIGVPKECLDESLKAMSAFRNKGARMFIPFFLAMQAEGLAKVGRPAEALEAVDEALSNIETTGERVWQADIYRTKGNLIATMVPDHLTEAEDCYRKAIRMAKDQEAKSWELRATTSLARLRQIQNKNHEAHEILEPVYDWFTEGFDTADLKDAKMLLDELA